MTIMQKLGVSIASVTVFASATAPLAFAEHSVDIMINGNGTGSTNQVTVNNTDKNVVEQMSVTTAQTVVMTTANSGGNTISGTTGNNADNSITTGNANSTSSVSVKGGDVIAVPATCGCEHATTVEIKNNGSTSKQKVRINNKRVNRVSQAAVTEALTQVGTAANAGDNKIKNTTGGSNTVDSGNATASTEVVVHGGTVAHGATL